MTIPMIQSAFSAGEISPELYGEVDLAKVHSAATTLRNCIVNYRGGALSRGGLAFVGRCKQAVPTPPRAIPFQFSNNQGYVLEFGDHYLRFVFQGGYIVETPIPSTGVTRANPAVASVAATPFSAGDWVFATQFQGMTELNGNTYIVAAPTPGSFALHDLNGNAVDSTGFHAYTSGGEFARIYELATPYAAEDLPYLKFAQTADVMSLTCSNPENGHEYPPYDLTRLAAADWTLVQTNFAAAINPPTSVSASSNAQAPTNGTNASFAYVVTAVDSDGNESIASAIARCHGADLQIEAGTNIVNWSIVTGAKYYNVYRAPISVDSGTVVVGVTVSAIPVPDGAIFGLVGSSFGTQFVDTNTTPDLTQTPPLHKDPFARGQILAVNITATGSGLTAVTYAITTAAGTAFAGNPLIISGGLSAFQITNGGKNYAPGDSIAFNGAGFATGAIAFGATNPSNGDTITLNGVVWTFVTTVTGANQTLIGGALSVTLALLVSGLSSSADASLTVASYSVDASGANLLVQYKTAGVGGNAYTLAASRATRSGATLTGGSGSGSAGSAATGNLSFTGNPLAGQNIILNGVTWTFVAAGPVGNQTLIGANLAATLAQLVIDLNASAVAAIALSHYTAASPLLNVAYKTVGAAGNLYTLAAGTAAPTPSGPTLTGGTDASVIPTGTLTVGPVSGTYPGVNAYFQQRHFFANSLNNPDTLWGSRTGLYRNMDTSLPTIATDAITDSPWTEQVNGVQWLIPMPGGLIAMTGLRAWQINGEGGSGLNPQPITPSGGQAQPQAFNGCSATIPPIVIDYDVLYVQAIGNTTVFDLSWNFWVNIYTGNDLTILSSHLFLYRQITQWAWARQPYKVLWACCNDGTMLSLTYLKEQNVYGWARHDTQGLVVSVCSITEPPVNAVYAIAQRFPPYAPQGIFVMERIDDRIWQTVEDTFALDSAVSNPLSSPNTALSASAASGAGVTFSSAEAAFSADSVGQVIRMCGGIATVTGYTNSQHVTGTWNLAASNAAPGFPYAPSGTWTIATPVTALNAPHLAGMTVSALLDGVPVAGITVGVTGNIPLPFAASNAKAGLPFTVQIQTPYLNGENAIQGGRKVIPAATFRIASSGKFQFGTNQPDGAALDPPQLAPAWTNLADANPLMATGGQTPPQTYTSPGGQQVTQLWTGDLRIVGGGASWISKGQVAVQQTLPLPLQVLAAMPEMLPGDVPEVKRQPQEGGQQQGPGPYMLKARI